MCDPVTLAVVGAGVQGGGQALAGFGQFQQAQAYQRSNEFSASQDEYNARVADAQAADALVRGGLERDQIRVAGARELGAGRAGFAAGNVDLSVGTPMLWELASATNTGKDLAQSRVNAEREALGFRTNAWNLRSQAGLKRWQGDVAVKAGRFGGFTSILGAAGQTAGGIGAAKR
jgi:hypothetical protein